LRISSILGRFPAVTRYLEVGDQVLELSRVKRRANLVRRLSNELRNF
jgi:hypothetical protein